MKKLVLAAALALSLVFVLGGCGSQEDESYISLYSFGGSSESLSLSGGVMMTGSQGDLFSGGDIEIPEGLLPEGASFSYRFFYISGGEEHDILSQDLSRSSGSPAVLSTSLGAVSSNSPNFGPFHEAGGRGLPQDLLSGLYFEIAVSDNLGEKSLYSLKLDVKELFSAGLDG